MQAFKYFFKIIFKNTWSTISVFTSVFMVFGILFSSLMAGNNQTGFVDKETAVAVIDRDKSELSAALIEFVKSKTEYVELEDDEDVIRDSLYYLESAIVVIVPENFGDDFLGGKDVKLETHSAPNSGFALLGSRFIDNWLDTVQIYNTAMGSPQYDKAAADQSLEITPELVGINSSANDQHTSINYFMNFLAYAFPGILIMIVGLAVIIFREQDVRRRNLCSPLPLFKMNLTVFASSGIISLVVLFFFVITAFIMFPDKMANKEGMMYLLNIAVFFIVCIALSFMLGNILTKRSINPATNVISLTMSFLGGAFVPLTIMSEDVKKFSVIVPTYWFVKSNDIIGRLSVFNSETLASVYSGLIVQLLFALAFLGIALVAGKMKEKE